MDNRIRLLTELGEFLQSDDPAWTAARIKTSQHNTWFTPDFISLAVKNIREQFLDPEKLESWLRAYGLDQPVPSPKRIGLVMAGNVPLVGFHDFLCCFVCGHRMNIKLSSKDPFLFPLILEFLSAKDRVPEMQTAQMLKGMDAYIATGSNNSARYFEYYFGKYPSLIRHNRTSVAVLDGTETNEELALLADDVFQYFGLGCRNVTQLIVPRHYDFIPMLNAFKKYHWMADHNKYKNNYDYRLSLAILNKQFYMTQDNILLIENESPFSPISVLHYRFYDKEEEAGPRMQDEIQCVVGKRHLPFGKSQQPALKDYADGMDTLTFLKNC